METCENAARQNTAREIAGAIDAIIERAHRHELETVVYILETAKVEALRATRPQAPGKPPHARLRF